MKHGPIMSIEDKYDAIKKVSDLLLELNLNDDAKNRILSHVQHEILKYKYEDTINNYVSKVIANINFIMKVGTLFGIEIDKLAKFISLCPSNLTNDENILIANVYLIYIMHAPEQLFESDNCVSLLTNIEKIYVRYITYVDGYNKSKNKLDDIKKEIIEVRKRLKDNPTDRYSKDILYDLVHKYSVIEKRKEKNDEELINSYYYLVSGDSQRSFSILKLSERAEVAYNVYIHNEDELKHYFIKNKIGNFNSITDYLTFMGKKTYGELFMKQLKEKGNKRI